ncbi:MAG: isochorismatase family protein [Mycoplasmoidaceae bacterium]
MKAVIVVDVQNDFSEIGRIPIKGVLQLANEINTFLKQLDRKEYQIIASKEWHHFKHISFQTFKSHCVYFSKGAEFVEPLNQFKFDLVVKKGSKKNIENFSCFYNGINKTKIDYFLKSKNIQEVYVVGVATDFCVKATIADLIKFGYQPILITDLTLAIAKDYKLQLDGLKKISLNQFYNR